MSPLPLAALAAVCLGAVPAIAGTYTENIGFAGSPSYDGTETINAAQFDPTLGTLTGVTLTASGSYTPSIFVGPKVPPQSVLNVELIVGNGPGALHQMSDGDYTLLQNGTYLTGPAEKFSETLDFTDPSTLKNVWTGLFPNEIVGVASVDAFSLAATPGAWGSMADDVSQFTGDLAITYTYTPVPEPASLALLAPALLLLLRRRTA